MKYLEKINEYLKKVSESLNNPVQIKWIVKGDIIRGLFGINNVYQIVAKKFEDNIWKYDFYHYKDKIFSPELTNIGSDKWQVLPTVSEGLQYLVDNNSVNSIIFGAADKSKGRRKLYESFCQKFSEKNNFLYQTNISEEGQIFIMYKEDCDIDILQKVLIQILESEK